MGEWAVGIDLGGTNIRAAEVDRSGRAGILISQSVDHADDRAPFHQLTAVVRRLIDQVGTPPAGIGAGITGPVDHVTGVIDNPHTLPASLQGDVRSALAQIAATVAIENDANCAALGEARHGAGRGHAVVVCITVGTGIGVGVVKDGVLVRGVRGLHPESGHIVVEPGGPLCYCGASGCVESISSARGVIAAAVAADIIDETASAKDVHDLAAADPRAALIVDRARGGIAALSRTLAVAHAADGIVLAGAALGATGPLLARVRGDLAAYAFAPPGGIVVDINSLAAMSGCIGAASLVLG